MGSDLLKCILLIHSKSHLPVAQQQMFWANSTSSGIFEGKFVAGNEDEGSDEDPTGDYIDEIQKKVAKIKQTYKLDGGTGVSSATHTPVKLSMKQPPRAITPQTHTHTHLPKPSSPSCSLVRRRIASSSSISKLTISYVPQSSAVLKKTLPNMKIATFDLSQELAEVRRRSGSSSKLRNVSESNLRLAKLMLGLPKSKY